MKSKFIRREYFLASRVQVKCTQTALPEMPFSASESGSR